MGKRKRKARVDEGVVLESNKHHQSSRSNASALGDLARLPIEIREIIWEHAVAEARPLSMKRFEHQINHNALPFVKQLELVAISSISTVIEAEVLAAIMRLHGIILHDDYGYHERPKQIQRLLTAHPWAQGHLRSMTMSLKCLARRNSNRMGDGKVWAALSQITLNVGNRLSAQYRVEDFYRKGGGGFVGFRELANRVATSGLYAMPRISMLKVRITSFIAPENFGWYSQIESDDIDAAFHLLEAVQQRAREEGRFFKTQVDVRRCRIGETLRLLERPARS